MTNMRYAWHHLDLQDLPLKANALLPAIVLRMNLDIFSFLKVSHKDTCLPHNIFSHELWVEMTAQAKLCPAIAALKTSGCRLGFEKNWIFLEVGDHDLNVDQGDEDVEAVRGQYRRVVFEKLILMTIYWWWWWCWPMNCEDIVWPAVLIHSRPGWVHLCRGVHRPRATAALWRRAKTSNTLVFKAFVGW